MEALPQQTEEGNISSDKVLTESIENSGKPRIFQIEKAIWKVHSSILHEELAFEVG